jgi:hypothetical protein
MYADKEARIIIMRRGSSWSFLLILLVLLACHVATAWVGSVHQKRPSPLLSALASSSFIIDSRKRRAVVVLQESASSDDDADATAAAAEKLLRKAEQLRQEVDLLEQTKRVVQQQEQRATEQEKAAAAAQRERYSAIVPILKPDGTTVEERCDFSPRYKDGSSFITTCLAKLPLGIVLGESEELAGCTMVDEVAADSNGAMAGLRQGDVVRAIAACRVTMETPTWQLMMGGIGVPKTMRMMYVVDNRPFEEVMDAVMSNRQDPEQRPVVIVVERQTED